MKVKDFLEVIHSAIYNYSVSDECGNEIFGFTEQELDKVPEKVLNYEVSSIELFDSFWVITVKTEM